MDILYQAKLERYIDKKDTLEQNLMNAYALIFSTYCNKTRQNRIKEHTDFETSIWDDLIDLLNKIKVLMHNLTSAKYPFSSLVTKAISRMLNLKQGEKEGLLDYFKRFKKSHDIMKSHVGTDTLDRCVKNTLEYWDESNATLKQDMKDRAFHKWMAYSLIRNSNQAKYGRSLSMDLCCSLWCRTTSTQRHVRLGQIFWAITNLITREIQIRRDGLIRQGRMEDNRQNNGNMFCARQQR
jgi:hypothetical protein